MTVVDELLAHAQGRALIGDMGYDSDELARKVRERFPELPILLTSGYSENAAGSHGFPILQKPYELATLTAALGKILKHDFAPD